MKRVIYLFTCAISFLLFISSFQYQSKLQRLQVENLMDSISLERNQTVVPLVLNIGHENRAEKLAMVTDFCDVNQYSLIAYQTYQREDLLENITIYIYSDNTFDELSFLKTKDNKKIDFLSNTTNYFSSHTNDLNSYDTIQFLNPSWNSSHKPLIEIKPFSNYIQESTENEVVYLFIWADDEEKAIDDILNSEIKDLLLYDGIGVGVGDAYYGVDNSSIVYILIGLCTIAITLFYMAEVLKQKKEIVTRKLFGQSTLFIIYKQFIKTIVTCLILFVSTQVVSYLFFVRQFSQITIPFIMILLRMIGMYVISLLVVLGFLCITIQSTCSLSDLRKGNTNRLLLMGSFTLKVILLLLVMNPLVEMLDDSVNIFQRHYALIKNNDNMRDNLYVFGIRHGSDFINDEENAQAVVSYLWNHNALYQDFEVNYLYELGKEFYDDEEIPEYELPYLEVNREYLNNYQLYTVEGNEIDIETLPHNTLLVPEKYKDNNLEAENVYNPMGNYTILYVQDGNTYYSYFPNHYPVPLYKEDPIISLKTEYHEGIKLNQLILSNADISIDDVLNYLTKEGLDDIVYIASTNAPYEVAKKNSLDTILDITTAFILYMFIVIMFLYQNTFIYFFENKKLLSIQYLVGKNFVQRHKTILQLQVLAYVLPGLLGGVLFSIPTRSIIMLISFTIVIDILISYVITKKFEKRNIVSILKGEEE